MAERRRYAGASTYVAELSSDRRRGHFSSWLDVGSYLGFAAGAATVPALVIVALSLPFIGRRSDRIGRKKVVPRAVLSTRVLAIPPFAIMLTGSYWLIQLAKFLFAIPTVEDEAEELVATEKDNSLLDLEEMPLPQEEVAMAVDAAGEPLPGTDVIPVVDLDDEQSGQLAGSV